MLDNYFNYKKHKTDFRTEVIAGVTTFLTMAMAAIGISINLNELKMMGYKPFIVGLIAAVTVGFVSLIYIQIMSKFFI